MPKVIGVKFRTSTRMYYFAPTEGEEYPKGTKVIVETQRGVEVATVVMPVTEVDESKIVSPLKGVMRIATEADLDVLSADESKKQEIIALAKKKVAERNLDMKIVDCEFTVDHSKLVLYFTAEQRVDFRELVRDLASSFHTRIDLRQIGAREECKLIGALGCCGLPCCCGRFESDAEHVSIKMAKCQNLALTPNKINGMCGRLLCCLSYENKTYEDVAKRSPKIGSWVNCPDGRRGTVVSVTPLTEKVRVRIGDEDNFEFVEFDLAEINSERKEGEGKPEQRQKPAPQNPDAAPQNSQGGQGGVKKKKHNNQNNNQNKNGNNGQFQNKKARDNGQNNQNKNGEGNGQNSQNKSGEQNNQPGNQNFSGKKKKKKHFNKFKSNDKQGGQGGAPASGQ